MRWVPLLLILSGCLINPRYRVREHRIPGRPKADRPIDDERFATPGSLDEAIRRLNTLSQQAGTLASDSRLFEIPDLADHIRYLASFLVKLDKEAPRGPVLGSIAGAGSELVGIASGLDAAAKAENADDARAQVEKLPAAVATLQKHAPLSDEYEVKQVPEECPPTYQRAVKRVDGVRRSLEQRMRDGLLWEVPGLTKHLRVVGENILAIAVNDIRYPHLTNVVRKSATEIAAAARSLRSAAQQEDAVVTEEKLAVIRNAVAAMEAGFVKIEGRSALESPPEREEER